VSLASVGASVALPVALLVGRFGLGHQTSGETLVATTLLAGFIVFTHRANVSRMWQGTEPTLGR
jgi:glycerol-3-phosphate acyltransferase PlsY